MEAKIENAKEKLKYYKIIENNGEKTQIFKSYLSTFGNLGSVKFNYALYESIGKKCSYEMIAIVAFLMYGTKFID